MKKERFSIFFSLILLLFFFSFSGCGPADTTHTITAGDGDAVTDTQPPTVPEGLVATTVSASQINLRWTASSDNVAVVGYIVKEDGGVIAALSATGYSDSGLESETEYCYSVAAYDGANNQSEYAGPVCATTLPEVVVGEWKLPFGYDGYSVISDASGNAYIGGGYDIDGNPFVGRINADGTVGWIKIILGTGGLDRGTGIAVSPDDKNIYIKYFFDIWGDTSLGYREFVAKFNAETGAIVWTHQLSVPCGTDGAIGSIHTAPGGVLFVAGRGCVTKLTDNGESVSEKFTENIFNARDVAVSADGSFYYSVGSLPDTDNNLHVVVAKYRGDNGAVIWQREWRRDINGGDSDFSGESICISSVGVVFAGTYGMYVADDGSFVHLPADIVRWDAEGNFLGETDYGTLPIGTASAATCGGSMAYFSAGTNGTGGLYAVDESGDVSLLNNTRGGSVSTDSIFVQGDLSIVYEVLDNVVLRFDAETGDQILP